MFRNFGAGEIILILLVVLLLFGARRLPDAARGLGRSLRIFKSEVSAMQDDDKPASSAPDAGAPVERPAAVDRPSDADR